MTGTLRLTWVQPEDLIGHELRQADEDGRDAGAVRDRWRAAGGAPAPVRAGASAEPAPPRLRALAERLLDELAALPSPLAAAEPLDWPSIAAACPALGHLSGAGPGPARRGTPGLPGGDASGSAGPPRGDAGEVARSRAAAGAAPPEDAARTAWPGQAPRPDGTHGDALHPRPSGQPPRTGAAYGDAPPTDRPGHPARTATAPPEHAPPGHPLRTAAGAGHAPHAHPSRTATAPGEDALHAAWLGRAAGCLLGKPVEKLPLDAIRALARATGNWPLADWFTARGVPAELAAAHPWNRRSAATSLAENIDGMPEDDDLNYPLLGLVLLRRHGRRFTTADVGALWLDELPAGRTFTAERVAYRNLLCGVEPPLTAVRRNPFREWIGAAIRADVHGWTNPGAPAAAAEQAFRDAALSHTANGVYSAMFVAATVAAAAGGDAGVHEALAAGLAVVPPRSRLAGAVRFGIAAARAEADFDRAVDRIHHAYGALHWVHAVPNAALLAAALTHADGDFTGSVCRAVSGGLDTDSNGATAGSVAGLLAGAPDALPERWTTPLKNRLATSVAGFDGVGFDTLARLTVEEALRP
ncbi:ADP-ribosylglycohydrolase family protein [Streptomyces zhihengii]|uniref:ADP-ribosylglycohydrolase family protein n=1 Tax=Streptomyces zhihengii TaxID=1818004 RepID=UPI00362DA89D